MWPKLTVQEKNHVNVLVTHLQTMLHLLLQFQPVRVMAAQL
jgi:hypothetical protein